MDPFLMGLFVGASYLTSLLGVQQVGLSLHHAGKPESAAHWFRLATQLTLNPKLRIILRGNLMAALHCSARYNEVDREWERVCPKLDKAGPFAPLLQSCYAASLYYRGRYQRGLEVTEWRGVPSQAAGAEDCEMLLFINRAACLFDLGRFEEAARALEEAGRRKSRQVVVATALHLALARQAVQANQVESALDSLSRGQFRELPPIYQADVELNRASLLARCNVLEEAEEILARPFPYESPRCRFLRPMATAYLWHARSEPRRALVEFQRCLDSGYPAGEASLLAGDLAAGLGDRPAARDFYLAAIGTDPESYWALLATNRLKQ
ncbi:MAG: hypothetical protein AMXMBFR33_70260 [Candidatus Xenobia bacterium]